MKIPFRFLGKKLKKADGYYVYNLDNDANKYVKLGESKGNENCKFEIKNIPSASVYEKLRFWLIVLL